MVSIQLIDLAAKPNMGSCNNNCIFCGAGYGRPSTGQVKVERDTERVKSELRKYKDERLDGVLFSGSGLEPTVRPDILELLSYANELGYKHIWMHSNGRMFCYPEFTKKIVERGCDCVHIGLHAQNAELHDKITRTPGSFEQTIQGIKNLLKYRSKTKTELIIAVHRLNYRHLPAVARFVCNELKGIDGVMILPVDVLPIKTAEPQMVEKIAIRLSEVRPYLHKGLAIFERNDFIFVINFMPFCIIDKKYWRNMLHRSINAGLITSKPPSNVGVGSVCNIFSSCSECVLKEKCSGTWRSYTERFGTGEFKPIRDIDL